MEIKTGKKPTPDGKVDVIVHYHDQFDGKGHSIEVRVWVDYSDSQAEMNLRAKEAAVQFLKRAVSAHDSGCPE